MNFIDILKTPRTRTFTRWKKLVTQTDKSLCRALTYEAIEGLTFKGNTIDIGGGKNNSYYHLIKFDGLVDSLNIDLKYEPTILGDLNSDLQIKSETYDNFICLNTYEHILNDDKAINESFRILKNGGHFVISIPFLYRIHASPFDFNRRTPYWWQMKFKELNLDISEITIEPLVWDSLASAYFTWHSVNGGFLGKIIMLRSVFRDRKIKTRTLPRNNNNLEVTNYSLGFVIKGKKVISFN